MIENAIAEDAGITSIGVYVPRMRMERAAIAKAHAWMSANASAPRGFKSYASWDEDALTMAVEAGRRVVAQGDAPRALFLASTTLPFADLQNSSIVIEALGLPKDMTSLDVAGSRRAATSALIMALKGTEPALVIGTESMVTRPASAQELSSGAAATAIRTGTQDVVARCLAAVSRSAFFVDSFRAAGDSFDYGWEERWIRDEGYLRLIPECAKAALKAAQVDPKAVAHFIVALPQASIAAALAKQIGLNPQACSPSHADTIGFAGTADAFLSLADVLERAEPDQIILLVGFGQGVDAVVLRTTAHLAGQRERIGFQAGIADRIEDRTYMRMLSFQGSVQLEWGMRAEKDVKTALTEQYRSLPQLGAFMAGKCAMCGTIQFPQLNYCVNPGCGASASSFAQVSLVDVPAKVFTFTADWLSYHASPPLYVGFVQFDNGARVLMEVVDVGPGGLETGMPLRMVYRVKDHDKVRGYKRYFWKATPVRMNAAASET